MKEIIYNQHFTNEQLNIISSNAVMTGILPDTAKLLYSRGLTSVKEIKRFLSPGKANFSDPFLLSGMSEAVERIKEARIADELVLVYGDYDADGISATTVLYKALTEYGLRVKTAIPNREDGYGLNVSIIEQLADEELIDLIITVDCGISNVREVEEIKDMGIDVIVTDHHEIPETLPDTVCINPKLDADKTFGGLCGAGVAFKLAVALLGERAYKYLDFVALATVADSMELVSENRDIVYEGLKLFSESNLRPVFADLLSTSSAKEVTSQTLAYTLAPRINAAGRMGDANCALKLFLSEDAKEIYDYSVKLNAYNLERQAECDKLYKLAKERLFEIGANKNVIMLYDESWRTGFVGIVAARLAEEYSRPVIIFAGQGGILKGSARSVEGINIFDAISSAKDLLEEFGGHAQAAGVAITKENFAEFENRVDAYLNENYTADVFIPKIKAETEITQQFSMKFARELERLEPYGVGNKKPLFTATVGAINANTLKPNSPHVVFKTPIIDMIKFNGVDSLELLDAPINKKVVFEINLSTYAHQTYIKGNVKDILPEITEDESIKLIAFEKALDGVLESDASHVDYLTKDEINNSIRRKKNRYSTVYIVSSLETLDNYPELKKMQKAVLKPTEKNLLDTVLIAPTSCDAIASFERVVYLDRGISTLPEREGQAVAMVKDVYAYDVFDRLDLSRSAFVDAFVKIKELTGKKYMSSVRFYTDNKPDIDPYQFIFALAVFTEVGIFTVSDGILKCDSSVKRDLTTAQIYTAVERLKARC